MILPNVNPLIFLPLSILGMIPLFFLKLTAREKISGFGCVLGGTLFGLHHYVHEMGHALYSSLLTGQPAEIIMVGFTYGSNYNRNGIPYDQQLLVTWSGILFGIVFSVLSLLLIMGVKNPKVKTPLTFGLLFCFGADFWGLVSPLIGINGGDWCKVIPELCRHIL